jgi:hypothetical protein
MSKVVSVGLDLTKNVFQAHRADGSDRAVLRKKLRREQVLGFFGRQQSEELQHLRAPQLR